MRSRVLDALTGLGHSARLLRSVALEEGDAPSAVAGRGLPLRSGSVGETRDEAAASRWRVWMEFVREPFVLA